MPLCSVAYCLVFLSTCAVLFGQESKPACRPITDQEMKVGAIKVSAHFETLDSKGRTVTFEDADGKTETWSASNTAINEAEALRSGQLMAMMFTMSTGKPM